MECKGHPAGPFDPMGETVYCDGSCRVMEPWHKAIVKAIRDDSVVGRGTCSTIDEAFSDDELLAEVLDCYKGPMDVFHVVAWARQWEEHRQNYADDIRNA